MIIDLEKLDKNRQLPIKLLAASPDDIIVDGKGVERNIDTVSFHSRDSQVRINGSYFTLEGYWMDDICDVEFNGIDIVDVIFTEKGNH